MHVFLLAMTSALAADPVVLLGRNVVVDAPIEAHAAEPAAAWSSVLADCAEEAAPGMLSIVDRTDVLHSKGQTKEVRAIGPRAVVVTHPVPQQVDATQWASELEQVIRAVRADGGPVVFVVGAIAPTVAQLVAQDVEKAQKLADERAAAWNQQLSGLAARDDGVWFIDVWKGWPRDAARGELTVDGWRLTDQAQARLGAVICEELLRRLRRSP